MVAESRSAQRGRLGPAEWMEADRPRALNEQRRDCMLAARTLTHSTGEHPGIIAPVEPDVCAVLELFWTRWHSRRTRSPPHHNHAHVAKPPRRRMRIPRYMRAAALAHASALIGERAPSATRRAGPPITLLDLHVA